MRKFFFVIILFCLTGDLLAQEDSAQARQLDEVIITGQYQPQSIRRSAHQVKVITQEKIRKLGATRLQDVLSNELNIRFSQDLATGGSGITMLGMKGQNVKILLDGIPLIGRQGTSNEIDINQLDIHSIEKIEIVEGPMAVIFGADALAGVINIITKKAGAEGWSVRAGLHEETIGNEYALEKGIHNQHTSVRWRKKAWELGGGAGRNYFGGWKDTMSGRELAWHRKDQLIANGFVIYRNGGLNIRYRIDGLDEIITNPGNFLFRQQDSGDTLAFDQEYLSRRLMHQLQGGYFFNSNASLQWQSSFTDYSRQVFSTTVSKRDGSVRLNMAEGSQSLVSFKGFTYRTLFLYRLRPAIALQPGVDINLESGSGKRLKEGKTRVADLAFFITSEITPVAAINIKPGIRFTRNSVYDAPALIPSLNTRFSLGSGLDLRMSYARGFRAPSLRELYFNFFDANHQIVGNPDLKAETSHSYTGSVSWKSARKASASVSAALAVFYNNVKNLIDYAVSENDPNVFILSNIDNTKTAGATLSGNLQAGNLAVSAGSGFTGIQNALLSEDASLPAMQWSAEFNAAISYDIPGEGLQLNLFYKFTGKKPAYIQQGPDIRLSEQEGFHWAEFTLNKKLSQTFMINSGIRNIFDVDYTASSVISNGVHSNNGVRSIGYGRSFFLGLVFSFEKISANN